MRRRDFVVATASTASVISTAGCLASEEDDEPSDNEENGRDFSLSDLEGFEDADMDSRFEGNPCPDLGDELTLCYHEVGTEPPVYLEPEREVGDPSEEPIEFTLHNEAPEPVEYHSSGGWELHKNTDDGWLRILPWVTTLEGPGQVRPGSSESWSIEMSPIEDLNEFFASAGARHTGPGTYAFSVLVGVEGYADFRLVALLESGGEPLSFEPVGVVEQERKDGVVYARTESHEEDEDRFVISATVFDGTQGTLAELHDEYAVQSNVANNTLAFLGDGDAEEVRFEVGETLLRRLSLLEAFGVVHENLEGETVIESLPNPSDDEQPSGLRFVNGGKTYEVAPVEHEKVEGEEDKREEEAE